MHRILIVLTALFLLSSCNKSKTLDEASPEITDYFKAYTRGMIHENDAIKFYLQDGVVPNVGVIEDAIKVEPSFPYTVTYDSGFNLIVLKPDENSLARGQEYDISIQLSDIFKQVKNLSMKTTVKVHAQHVDVERKGILFDNETRKFLDVHISTAIDETPQAIKSIFTETAPERITVARNSEGDYSAQILLDDAREEITWNGIPLGSHEKGSIQFWNDDLDGFKVINTYHDRKEQSLTAYFSRLIDEKQDATGLILVGDDAKNYTIDKNIIKVFINEPTRETVNVIFKKGLRSADGKVLASDYTHQMVINLLKPEIQWMSEGTYIPNEGDFRIPFKTKGLKKVKVNVTAIDADKAAQFVAWNGITSLEEYELRRYGDFYYEKIIDLDEKGFLNLEGWNEYGLDLTDAFEREPGFIYRIDLSFVPSYTILSCDDPQLKHFERDVKDEDWFERKYRDYGYYGYYNYQDRNNPCKPSFYYDNIGLSKNVHCTNVFPIIKKGENELTIALKHLTKNKTATGAKVGLLTLQGDVFQEQQMGTSGIVRFENLDRTPHAVRVDFYNDISYFSLESGKEVPITEFDISSNVKDVDNKLFVYSDRGVRRPGDTIVLNVMVNRAALTLPADIPVMAKIYNPKGVLMHSASQPFKEDQYIYTFKFPTSVDDITGYWRAEINTGPIKKKKNIRIETIRPNVVDAVYTIENEEDGWVYDNKLTGQVKVDYLAGYAMKSGQVEAKAKVIPLRNPFPKWLDYNMTIYDLPITDQVSIMDVSTDNKGKSDFKSNVNFKNYQTVSRVIMDTQIDLPGGGANSEVQSFNVSPFTSYVGIHKARGKGWRGSYKFGEKPYLKLIHLDQRGKLKKGNSTVKAHLYKAKKDWWYDRYRLSRDHSVRIGQHYVDVDEFDINFKDGKGAFNHKDGLESGVYVLILKDPESGHQAEYKYHVVTSNAYAVKANPEFLELSLEKRDYDSGEVLNLNLPSILDSRALITIERGSKVLESFWMDLKTPSLELPIKDDWFPNFYLNVNIVQNYQQDNNDRPLRMYAIEKITVNERKETLEPVISVAEKVRPNETFTIDVSEANGQPMDYTITVVDRGLLNLTGFKTPDPLSHFNKQYALLIKTWDILKDLIYFMDPNFSGVFSIGGDGALKQLDESADFNRFEPVVFNLGPFKLPAGGQKKHTITLPNYIGSLSVAVVAANDKTFGNADKDVRVAAPLMVQTQMPRSLNVSDKVTLPITLFKDEASIKNVSLSAVSQKEFLAFANTKTDVSMSEDQALANLSFTVKDKSGATELSINAAGNGYKAEEKTKIFVNYPNSYEDKLSYYKIAPMTEEDIEIDAFGYEKTKHVTLTMSGLILPAFASYYSSLIGYPYGCLEQTTSKGIAMLYLEDLIKLTAKERLSIKDNLDAAVIKVTSYQNGQGRFSYWRNGYYHEWADLYAGHFLLDAKEKGHMVNNNALKNWIDYTGNVATKWRAEELDPRITKRVEMVQAYRLYLLAKANQPIKSAMNRFRKRDLGKMAKVLLAGAYHYTGMDDIAKDLFYESMDLRAGRYDYYTFGTDIRNKAIVLMILSELESGDRVDRYYEEWVKEVNAKGWLSTQEKGFIMMACDTYLRDRDDKLNEEIRFNIASQLHNEGVKVLENASKSFAWEPEEIVDNAKIANTGNGELYVVKTERSISDDLYRKGYEDNLNLTVKYLDLNGNAINTQSMKQGEEVLISVTIVNNDVVDHNSLALNVKTPSGWELINPRLIATASTGSNKYNYQDYRDDRVYTFFGLRKGGKQTFSFRAKANLKGDYYLPPVSCEHMYLKNVRARNEGSRVKID